ncbi:hypothetical protein MKEN_00701200 [Mycena kentingensis (nom. inval.)]|nr:hypothetical protein MKEN_00701200 [Mycena kentingensis (nom. inval.)]
MYRLLRRAAQCRPPSSLYTVRRTMSTRPPFIPPIQDQWTPRHELEVVPPGSADAESFGGINEPGEDHDLEGEEGEAAEEVQGPFKFLPKEPKHEHEGTGGKPMPTSPSFYSGRAAFYDQLTQIENAVQQTRSALTMLQLLPLPDFARTTLPVRPAIWKSAREVAADLNVPMTSSRYRQLTRQLGMLNQYYCIATAAGCEDIAKHANLLLSMFESPAKEAALGRTRGGRKTRVTDQLGRSYTFGKRKTSTARVWMIPVQRQPPPKLQRIDLTKIESLDEAEALLKSQPEQFQEPQVVPTASILINNIPLGEFFDGPADRERVVRPLKLAGLLSAYNIFTLVRGGGTTGQSGALAHGIAKGLVVHNPDLETLLRRTKMLRRDPRMVERKKPGKAKARKAYAWVRR